MATMHVSSENNTMQGTVKESKMLSFFNALEEIDKDIVIAMTESLVERCKGNKNYKTAPNKGQGIKTY